MNKSQNKSNFWELEKTVLPQHTDHAGVMWHGSYVQWLEESRCDALLKVGCSYGELSKQGFEMPVVRMTIRYKKPLSHGNDVLIKNSVSLENLIRLKWNSFFLLADETVCAEAVTELVFVKMFEQRSKIVRDLPENIALVFRKLCEGPSE
tara:strand:- start:1641 stop:2090 length:450 start_codon:yes stop_codon:yes gene_type:complete